MSICNSLINIQIYELLEVDASTTFIINTNRPNLMEYGVTN